jgi:hypothetical protein
MEDDDDMTNFDGDLETSGETNERVVSKQNAGKKGARKLTRKKMVAGDSSFWQTYSFYQEFLQDRPEGIFLKKNKRK